MSSRPTPPFLAHTRNETTRPIANRNKKDGLSAYTGGSAIDGLTKKDRKQILYYRGIISRKD